MDSRYERAPHNHNSKPQLTPIVPASGSGADERRRTGRMALASRAIERGTDASGQAFEYETRLDNISATGLFVRLPRQVESGSRLFVLFPFPTASSTDQGVARVAVRGTVRRIEHLADGTLGAGISFQHYRLV